MKRAWLRYGTVKIFRSEVDSGVTHSGSGTGIPTSIVALITSEQACFEDQLIRLTYFLFSLAVHCLTRDEERELTDLGTSHPGGFIRVWENEKME